MGVRIHREYPPNEGIYYDLFLVAFLAAAAEGSLEGHKNYHTWRYPDGLSNLVALFLRLCLCLFLLLVPE